MKNSTNDVKALNLKEVKRNSAVGGKRTAKGKSNVAFSKRMSSVMMSSKASKRDSLEDSHDFVETPRSAEFEKPVLAKTRSVNTGSQSPNKSGRVQAPKELPAFRRYMKGWDKPHKHFKRGFEKDPDNPY